MAPSHAENSPEFAPGALTERPELTLRERVLQAVEHVEFNLSAIQTEDDVEMHTYRIMDDLPEAQANAEEIAFVRKNGLDERAAVAKQEQLYIEISHEVALISGVELDSARVRRENSEYRQRAQDLFADVKDVNSRDLLVKTGFLHEAENGEMVFRFPTETFPPHIVEKWDHYLDIVKRHVVAEKKREHGLEDDTELIAQLEKIRRSAHNNLSQDILDFMQIPDWDLEKTRNFVIKMRDTAIPNIETAEENVTADAVLRLMAEVKDLTQ